MARTLTKKASLDSLASLRADPLIDLELKFPFDLFTSEISSTGIGASRVTVAELFDRANNHALVVLGPPGAGKTTLLVQVADATVLRPDVIPVFVSLARYSAEGGIGITVTSIKGYSLLSCVRLLSKKKVLLLLDGINEAPNVDIDSLVDEITKFIEAHPNICATIATCRTTDFPPWAREFFSEIHIQAPTFDQVCSYLRDGLAQEFDHSAIESFISDRRVRTTLRVCNTPLLTVMLRESARQSKLEDFSFLASRAALYQRFCSNLLVRDKRKRRPTEFEKRMPPGLQDTLLSWVGLKMQTGDMVFVREGALQEWIAEWLETHDIRQWVDDPAGFSSNRLSRFLISHPPFRVIDDPADQDRLLAFLHPSFGEFYAAQYLCWRSTREPVEKILDALLKDRTRKNWETIRFLSGLTNSGQTASTLLSLAATEKDQEVMALAALVSFDRVDATIVDIQDVILRVLDAFKNWGQAFQYDIIRVMQTLPNQIHALPNQMSPIRQSRLFEDVTYFIDKYAHTEATELRHTPLVKLIPLMDSSSLDDQVNAAYTLFRLAVLGRIADTEALSIVQQFYKKVCVAAQEHLMASLKEAPSREATAFLIGVVTDDKAAPKVRSYALNALGMSRDEGAIDVIVSYLKDHKNPYRDSASWSLQVLVKALLSDKPDELKNAQRVFFDLLTNEANDQTGRYAKGNLVYSLGALNARGLAIEIIHWLEGERDPYVVEDGVYCLGLLGEPKDELANAIRPLLRNPDPGVRFKAVESLGLIWPTWAAAALKELINDEFPYIRWMANAAAKKLELGHVGT